ncbi:uncharacterized protein VTP21DRAFT_6957 [Calcarisporiella thermophila]|uniref:uncharacterized protein n=1 Tax=Calcarisporiella thermophila TaxID=911321 RepID=UPI003741EE34
MKTRSGATNTPKTRSTSRSRATTPVPTPLPAPSVELTPSRRGTPSRAASSRAAAKISATLRPRLTRQSKSTLQLVDNEREGDVRQEYYTPHSDVSRESSPASTESASLTLGGSVAISEKEQEKKEARRREGSPASTISECSTFGSWREENLDDTRATVEAVRKTVDGKRGSKKRGAVLLELEVEEEEAKAHNLMESVAPVNRHASGGPKENGARSQRNREKGNSRRIHSEKLIEDYLEEQSRTIGINPSEPEKDIVEGDTNETLEGAPMDEEEVKQPIDEDKDLSRPHTTEKVKSGERRTASLASSRVRETNTETDLGSNDQAKHQYVERSDASKNSEEGESGDSESGEEDGSDDESEGEESNSSEDEDELISDSKDEIEEVSDIPEAENKVGNRVGESSESEDDEDLENMENLLNMAEAALRKQQEELLRLPAEEDSKQKSFPKLEPGIEIKSQLYIQRGSHGAAKLASSTLVASEIDKSRGPRKVLGQISLPTERGDNKLSKKERKELRDSTAGAGWFDMPKPELTPELKRELQVLKLRNVLDPKRHYKKADKTSPAYFQVGTVIEGSAEFYSSRLTRKERKRTILEEVMGDTEMRHYYKRKFREVQESSQSGGKKAQRQRKQDSKPVWKKTF